MAEHSWQHRYYALLAENARQRNVLRALVDATESWYDTDGDADRLASAIDATESALAAALRLLGGDE